MVIFHRFFVCLPEGRMEIQWWSWRNNGIYCIGNIRGIYKRIIHTYNVCISYNDFIRDVTEMIVRIQVRIRERSWNGRTFQHGPAEWKMSGRTFQLGELCIVIQPESLGFHIIQEIDDILVAFGEQHLLIIIDWVSPLVIRYGVFS